MSEESDVFDVERVRDLVQLMIDHGLSELDLRQHGQTIKLRRDGLGVAPVTPVAAAAPAVPVAPTAPAPDISSDEDLHIITSPMVGTYYSRPNPEAAEFIKVGQEISEDTTICIIEAMKVFNEIAAEVSGTIVAVLVENEEAVEFGKPLFKVRPRK